MTFGGLRFVGTFRNSRVEPMMSVRWGKADLTLALQLRFLRGSESMGNHDSKIVDAGSVD